MSYQGLLELSFDRIIKTCNKWNSQLYGVRQLWNKPGLIEATRTLPGLEGVHGGRDDEEEREEKADHEGVVYACVIQNKIIYRVFF